LFKLKPKKLFYTLFKRDGSKFIGEYCMGRSKTGTNKKPIPLEAYQFKKKEIADADGNIEIFMYMYPLDPDYYAPPYNDFDTYEQDRRRAPRVVIVINNALRKIGEQNIIANTATDGAVVLSKHPHSLDAREVDKIWMDFFKLRKENPSGWRKRKRETRDHEPIFPSLLKKRLPNQTILRPSPSLDIRPKASAEAIVLSDIALAKTESLLLNQKVALPNGGAF
jgi:hypothetical protein